MFEYLKSFFWSAPVTLVDDQTKFALPLAEKTEINYNTRKFRFRLPSENHVLGIAPGQHVCLSATVNSKLVVRSYTPVSNCEQPGYVDIIVKIYFRGQHPSFPDGGKMSQHLDQLKIGDTVDFRGPTGSILYKGAGVFSFKKLSLQRNYRTISMIAGGSGLTPMLQIISTVIRNPADRTEIRFLFANTEERDILCREELDDLIQLASGRLTVHLIVSKPDETWKGRSGRIGHEALEQLLHPPAEDHLVLLCGPTPMINEACKPNLEKLGYSKDHLYVF